MSDVEKGNMEVGVRAIFLYPMNALVNDQIDRVRKILTQCPEITYGFFTGETKESVPKNYREKYGAENNTFIPENELVSREEIRKNPHSVILLDEIEKAHPSVLNLFLQILDEGKITDSRGNTVHFNHHVIIMTSNIGCHQDSVGFTQEVSKEDSKLKEFLSLELLNRIQKVVYFKKLDSNDIKQIIKIKLDYIKKKFKERNIKVHISDSIIDDMVVLTRYQEFGARKIDQVLEDKVDDTIIDSILEGKTNIYVNNHS